MVAECFSHASLFTRTNISQFYGCGYGWVRGAHVLRDAPDFKHYWLGSIIDSEVVMYNLDLCYLIYVIADSIVS